MKKIITIASIVITALVGAVIYSSAYLNIPPSTNAVASVLPGVIPNIIPVAPDAEAVVKVPEPIPEIPTIEREAITAPVPAPAPAPAPAPELQPAPEPAPAPQSAYTTPGRPVHIEIPNANVNATVMDVGVTDEGNLDVPPNFTDVGWYKYGTLPGDLGSAVLDGHVDNGGAIDGVFKRLRVLNPGDDIYIDTEQGGRLHFKVMRSDIYSKNEFPGGLVFHEGGAKMIKLITCHGTFLPNEDTYDLRLVVTAVLVE